MEETKTKKRKFSEIRDNMTGEQFKTFCASIAFKYATSDAEFSQSYYAEKYDVSIYTIRKVLEEAVINDWVPESIVARMEKKACTNQRNQEEVETSGLSSIEYYGKLRKERNNLLLARYSNEEIRIIAERFAYNPDVPKDHFAKVLGMYQIIFDKLIKKAIEEVIVDDLVVEKIKERTLAKTPKWKIDAASEFFNVMQRKRNSAKEKLSS